MGVVGEVDTALKMAGTGNKLGRCSGMQSELVDDVYLLVNHDRSSLGSWACTR